MRRYEDEPFNGEDMYRLPAEVTGQQPVVYQMPKQVDKRKKPFLGGKPYSILSASKYILMISLMLYWLPLVGQMIGGFIGGRRAGSPFRAILAAFIPIAVLFCISAALQSGIIPIKLQNGTYLAYVLIEQALEKLPVASVYVNFATTYVGSFINELKTATSLKLGNYLITIAFSYVGGILSDQSRRELEYVSRYGSPTTNILVSNRDSQQRREFQFPNPVSFLHSLRSARRHGPSGFASLMPVSFSANGPAPARSSMANVMEQPAPQPVAYASQGIMRRRVAPSEPGPRSWEDVYLRNMRVAGVSGPSLRRPGGYLGSKSFSRARLPEAEEDYEEDEADSPVVRDRSPQRSVTPVIRRDRLREESTRKLVERALGKDYMRTYNKREHRQVSPFANSTPSQQPQARKLGEPSPRKNGEWELL